MLTSKRTKEVASHYNINDCRNYTKLAQGLQTKFAVTSYLVSGTDWVKIGRLGFKSWPGAAVNSQRLPCLALKNRLARCLCIVAWWNSRFDQELLFQCGYTETCLHSCIPDHLGERGGVRRFTVWNLTARNPTAPVPLSHAFLSESLTTPNS